MPTYLPKSQHTRFLYPFFFSAQSSQAEDILSQSVYTATKSGKQYPLWLSREPHTLYQDEMLESIKRFLFESPSRYLKVNEEVLANHWFKNTKLYGYYKKNPRLYFEIDVKTGIELFLSDYGVGVLSITFSQLGIENDLGDDYETLKNFNYRLSQGRPFTLPTLFSPNLAEKPEFVPTDYEATLPIEQRLGKQDCFFNLIEFREYLLSPLKIYKLNTPQSQFSIYTVVQFDNQVDFTDKTVCRDLRPLVVALSHIEEAGHAGNLEVKNQIFNARHWAGVGTLGIAHLIAYQHEPPKGFDFQRLSIILNRYFIPYLSVFMQRLVLQRSVNEATRLIQQRDVPESQRAKELQKLHFYLLNFSVTGYLPEVSNREVLNQFYRLIQQGLRVDETFSLAKNALHDVDTTDITHNLHKNVSAMAEIQHNMAQVQQKVEWLEIFFVSYYAMELVDKLGNQFTLNNQYVQYSIIGWPLVAMIFTAIALKPWQREKSRRHWISRLFYLIGLLLLAGIWLALGMHYFPQS